MGSIVVTNISMMNLNDGKWDQFRKCLDWFEDIYSYS